MTVQQRQQRYLQKIAAIQPGNPAHWASGSTFTCLLAAGDAGLVEKANQWMLQKVAECNQRMDCTDFRLNLLLRAIMLFPDRIRPEVKQAVKDALLAGRYYGGFNRDWPMFYSSENHHMNWTVAEYLAAQLFPDETFGYDGRPARAHRARARFLIGNWIDQRARWGYEEWNSSCYMGIDLLSLLNLVDLSDEPHIRQLATDSVTRLLADLAADSLDGGIWGVQARMYTGQLFSRQGQTVSPAMTILLGAGDVEELGPSEACGDAVATTSYRPPQWLCNLARCDGPMVNLEKHRDVKGIYYLGRSTFWRPPAEFVNETERRRVMPELLIDVHIRTERNPAYIVSAVQSSPPSAERPPAGQTLFWLSSLKGRLTVFANQPPANAAKYGQWAGSSGIPWCFLQDGVLGAVFAGEKPQSADFTHAYFPTTQMDEFAQTDGWFLGRYQDAYVGLRPSGPATLTADGEYVGREIVQSGRRGAWTAIYGSQARDGDWQGFVDCCRAATVMFDADKAVLEVRSGATRFSICPQRGVYNDGQPFTGSDWKQMDNPVVQADYGDPKMRIRTPAGEEVIDFSAAAKLTEQWPATA